MAFTKGKSGNPGGRKSEKPFADALRIELAAAGEDQKALRAIARNLIAEAQKSENALPAIREIADRLDGKPAQAIIGGGDDDPAIRMLHRIERVIVDPQSTDTNSEGIPPAT